MDSSELDDTQYMTVKCQHCNEHHPLNDIKEHINLHSVSKLTGQQQYSFEVVMYHNYVYKIYTCILYMPKIIHW